MTNILLGTVMMVLTTGVHSVFTVFTFFMLRRWVHHRHDMHPYIPLALISGTILVFFAASLVEVGMWAAAYLVLGALEGLEPSLYYSMVTFTTLGYGDIVLPDRWRLLASFEAANGIIMFGWTTAIVMAVAQKTFATLLEQRQRNKESSA